MTHAQRGLYRLTVGHLPTVSPLWGQKINQNQSTRAHNKSDKRMAVTTAVRSLDREEEEEELEGTEATGPVGRLFASPGETALVTVTVTVDAPDDERVIGVAITVYPWVEQYCLKTVLAFSLSFK